MNCLPCYPTRISTADNIFFNYVLNVTTLHKCWDGMKLIHLPQWRALANGVMNLMVEQTVGTYLSN
jgi:hypothetical protein